MAASGPSELVPGPVLENGTLESGDISSAQIPEGPEVQTQAGNDPEPELDPELLEALGMSKDNKEKMLKEYLIPDNCRLLQSPKLNPEISAAVPDLARNRDKGLMSQQQQLGSGITAVNRTLDLLLKGDSKKEAIQHLSNACRILSDLHAVFTKNRIKLITSNLDKNFLHVIQDSERDETLFGTKLSDKIKAAKAIERQGQQIRKSNPPRASNASHSGTSSIFSKLECRSSLPGEPRRPRGAEEVRTTDPPPIRACEPASTSYEAADDCEQAPCSNNPVTQGSSPLHTSLTLGSRGSAESIHATRLTARDPRFNDGVSLITR
ncbi:hypothetical protein NE865_01360 [Phthorimaea operculella]|nr:hypothetical protein NE865_01360 [Phthorimaea operculella]